MEQNICKERSALAQVVVGSMDGQICTLIHLGVFLEMTFQHWVTSRDLFIFGDDKNTDTQARAIINCVIELGEFSPTEEGNLGTYLVCKGNNTYCARASMPKDDRTNQGQWRTTTMVNRCILVMLLIPDKKTLAVLSGLKVTATYKIKACTEEMVTKDFILLHVPPDVQSVMGDRVSLLLGRALL